MLNNMPGSLRLPLQIQRRLILLLALISIGCLGSLPIAPHLLAAINQPTSSPHQTRTYSEGQCALDVTQIIYVPPVTKVTPPASLPQAWTQAGRSGQDYASALACAATFVQTYESFDYHQINTLYTAIPLLSAAAKKRFYEGDSTVSANIRTDGAWQSRIKQDQIIQIARVSLPVLLDSEYLSQELYLTLSVPYQSIEQIAGQTTTRNQQVTVLIDSLPSGTATTGTGWQISDWRENA